MSNQPRVVKVLLALLVSMTIGAIVLMALGNNPPSDANVFSLSNHFKCSTALKSRVNSRSDRWDSIEIFYSGSTSGNIETLAKAQKLPNADSINCHFVICNGRGGDNGTIFPTERWMQQASAHSKPRGTIRICIVGQPKRSQITPKQANTLQQIVEHLSKKFGIESRAIFRPRVW